MKQHANLFKEFCSDKESEIITSANDTFFDSFSSQCVGCTPFLIAMR